jgi:hypothetical protein
VIIDQHAWASTPGPTRMFESGKSRAPDRELESRVSHSAGATRFSVDLREQRSLIIHEPCSYLAASISSSAAKDLRGADGMQRQLSTADEHLALAHSR